MENNTSVIRVLLLFYILIGNNFTENVFSHQLRDAVKNNRYAQHFIAYIMLLVLMIIGGNMGVEWGVIYTTVIYLWFIFTTKLDIEWNIIILLLLLFGFIYETKTNEREKEIQSDETLDEKKKETLIEIYETNKLYILMTLAGMTILGTSLYINKQEEQHGGSYDMMKFLFA
jgi:hypothetical protein